MGEFLGSFTDFVQRTNWVLPALGLIFVFLCIVSKGFRNFIVGLIILVILIFECFWFYDRFLSTEEERAELKVKVEEVIEKAKSTDGPKAPAQQSPTVKPPPPPSPTVKPIQEPPPTPTLPGPTPPPPAPTRVRYRLRDRKF